MKAVVLLCVGCSVVLASTIIPSTVPPSGCTDDNVHYYKEREKWNNSKCQTCECTNATTGDLRCYSRCIFYMEVPVGCEQVPDPNDPGCCKLMECQPGYDPSSHSTLIPGYMRENFTGCVFGEKGYNAKFRKGERWQVGCERDYLCTHAGPTHQGYQSTEHCKKYENVAPNCELVEEDYGCRCKVPKCYTTTHKPDINGGESISKISAFHMSVIVLLLGRLIF